MWFFILGILACFVRWEPAPYDLIFFIFATIYARNLTWRPYQLGFAVLFGLLLLAHVPALGVALQVAPERAFFYAFVTLYLALSSVLVMALPGQAIPYLLSGYEVGAVLSALLGILAFFKMPGLEGLLWGGSRAVAFFKDPNVFGAFLIPALFLALARLEQGRKFWILPTLILFLGVLVSLSRGAWANLVVALLGWWLLRPKKRIWLPLTLLLLVGSVGLSVAAMPDNPIAQRLGLMPYDKDRFSTQVEALSLALAMLLGYGPGLSEVRLSYATHNTYVRFLAEVGSIGLFFWLLILGASLIWALYKSLKQQSLWHEVYFVALLGIAVESLVIDTLHWRHLWLLLGLVWARHAPPLPHHPR
ncbi:O-antigen ligase family protein [Thermus sp.]|uniref:O-antigen ligase family protein n=1 Tax=Thermus sp. TaxID=275 RepID=UPI003D0A8F7A